MGPVNASARAATLPGTSARQKGEVTGDLKIYRGYLHADHLQRSPNRRQARWDDSRLPTEDHLKPFLLLRAGIAVHKQGSFEAGGLTGPDVALEDGRQYEF